MCMSYNAISLSKFIWAGNIHPSHLDEPIEEIPGIGTVRETSDGVFVELAKGNNIIHTQHSMTDNKFKCLL